MNNATRKTTNVAVGVLLRPDGAVLLADRPSGKPYAGYWEFPGGKIEAGETVEQALGRELHEELGIEIHSAWPWVTFEHDYPHAYVRLHFYRVWQWQGEPQSREGQRFSFVRPAEQVPAPLLPAAIPAWRWLGIAPCLALSQIVVLGVQKFLTQLERQLAQGLRLVLLREPELADDLLLELLPFVSQRVRAAGAQLLLSSRHQALYERNLELVDGLHLTAQDLLKTKQRPKGEWISASVHDQFELQHAAQISCDFVVAGPVLPTRSHPGQPTLGWHGFKSLVQHAPLPVFAIGGLQRSDLVAAQQSGAHGVAMLSAAWI